MITTLFSYLQRQGVVGDKTKSLEVSHRRSGVWDRSNRCVFCDKDQTHFARHIFRKHGNQESVRQIQNLPKNDKQRKVMLNQLRKEGNLALLDDGVIRPVQRASGQHVQDTGIKEFVPCPYCSGVYRRASLRHHCKKCPYKTDAKGSVTSMGHNVLAFRRYHEGFVKKLGVQKDVLSRMHADRPAFIAKNDPVICQYGIDFHGMHTKPTNMKNTRNKIREVGRLLIPLQDMYGIKNMIDVLDKRHYQKVVYAAKIICGYNADKRTFVSPSLALHLQGILKALCGSAKSLLVDMDPVLNITNWEETIRFVDDFSKYVDERWRFDIGSLALKDLKRKRGKKMQKIPVTSDIVTFKKYAVRVAEQSTARLQENPQDVAAFKLLGEICLVMILLLNRRRVGDVHLTELEAYYDIDTTNTVQEECMAALTETEKVLSSHFKRVLPIGKGHKRVSVLLPPELQKHLEFLLRCRKDLVPEDNPYLFANVGGRDTWLNGHATLRKHAKKCGAEHPETLTSNGLRKQVATVLQLLLLSDTEKEQIASFMGHTKKTHEEYYRYSYNICINTISEFNASEVFKNFVVCLLFI